MTIDRGTGDDSGIGFLIALEDIIRARIEDRAPESYVAALVAEGDRRIAQKLGEEAIELALAAAAGNAQEQIEEAADLVFHLLVLLNAKGIRLADVTKTLKKRHAEARHAGDKRQERHDS